MQSNRLRPVLTLICVASFVVAFTDAARGLSWRHQEENLSDKSSNFCLGCRSLVSFATRLNSSSQRETNKKAVQDYCQTVYPASTDYQQGPCPIFAEGVFYVIDRIDPVTHCDEIGACGPTDEASSTELIRAEPSKLGDKTTCEICEQMILQVQAQLENPTLIDLIKRRTGEFCDYLAIINETKECRQFVEQYVDSAIDFIRQVQPLKVCQSIYFCDPNKDKTLVPMKPFVPPTAPLLATYQGFGIETKVIMGNHVVKDLSSTPERVLRKGKQNCMFCKAIVVEMFKFLRENRTEENIRSALDKVCSLVYRRNQPKLEQCDALVATYSKELVELLVDETDPELICMLLEQCTYQAMTNSQDLLEPAVPEEEAEEPSVGSEPVDMNNFISMLDPSVQPGSIGTCVECKLFIEYLRDQIENPKSVDQIRDWLLTNLCDTIEDKKAQASCVSMVNNYAAVFFKAVATELDPKTACMELKACTKRIRFPISIPQRTSSFHRIPHTKKVAEVQKVLVNTQLCDQCVQIVTSLDEYLSSHPIDHDVSVLVDQVCNNMPNESSKTECTVLVRVLGQDIAQAISSMESPKQLCSKIFLC